MVIMLLVKKLEWW